MSHSASSLVCLALVPVLFVITLAPGILSAWRDLQLLRGPR